MLAIERVRNPWAARGRVWRVSRRARRLSACASVGRPPRGVVLHVDRSERRASFGQPCNRSRRNRRESAPGYPRVRSSARPVTSRRPAENSYACSWVTDFDFVLSSRDSVENNRRNLWILFTVHSYAVKTFEFHIIKQKKKCHPTNLVKFNISNII